MRAWPALALACCLMPAWAQSPPAPKQEVRRPVPAKAQKAHRKATPEQIRKFNQLQRKSGRR